MFIIDSEVNKLEAETLAPADLEVVEGDSTTDTQEATSSTSTKNEQNGKFLTVNSCFLKRTLFH